MSTDDRPFFRVALFPMNVMPPVDQDGRSFGEDHLVLYLGVEPGEDGQPDRSVYVMTDHRRVSEASGFIAWLSPSKAGQLLVEAAHRAMRAGLHTRKASRVGPWHAIWTRLERRLESREREAQNDRLRQLEERYPDGELCYSDLVSYAFNLGDPEASGLEGAVEECRKATDCRDRLENGRCYCGRWWTDGKGVVHDANDGEVDPLPKLYFIRWDRGDAPVYWRPNSSGYTTEITEAGLYSEEEARRQVEGSPERNEEAVEARPLLMEHRRKAVLAMSRYHEAERKASGMDDEEDWPW